MRDSIHGPLVAESDVRVLAGAVCGVYDTLKVDAVRARDYHVRKDRIGATAM
ncbi:MAG: hypothetical protein ACYC3X_29640 [Pirellulaceae bacterium]